MQQISQQNQAFQQERSEVERANQVELDMAINESMRQQLPYEKLRGPLMKGEINQMQSFKLSLSDIRAMRKANNLEVPKSSEESEPEEDPGEQLLSFIQNITPNQVEESLCKYPQCTICFEDFDQGQTVRVMPECGHIFHLPCID
jgi:hypothetical protein